MARAVLVDGGYVVVGEAADGVSAIAARRLRPDCVLLDVQLGDVDGVAAADALSIDGDGPAVVLTSGRDPHDLDLATRASAARGLIAKKKLSPAALGELLRSSGS
jgi:two-component system nitrate/nitrite response regulator NarL